MSPPIIKRECLLPSEHEELALIQQPGELVRAGRTRAAIAGTLGGAAVGLWVWVVMLAALGPVGAILAMPLTAGCTIAGAQIGGEPP